MSESKLMRNARSLLRSTLCRNSEQASCSMVSTRVWLGLVSTRIPSVSGWFDSAEKYFMVCCLPSSKTSKSFLVRLGMSRPCLSFTLKKRLTTLTWALKVCNGSSCSCDCCSCDWEELGFWDRGFSAGPVDCATKARQQDRNRHSTTTRGQNRLNNIVSLSGST